MKNLSNRLRHLRQTAGLTMTDVAERSRTLRREHAHVTQGYISRLESGVERNPSLAKCLTLAHIYGVSLNELVGWYPKKGGTDNGQQQTEG
jgi:transcriptional regulator with XRE-family HTH domain